MSQIKRKREYESSESDSESESGSDSGSDEVQEREQQQQQQQPQEGKDPYEGMSMKDMYYKLHGKTPKHQQVLDLQPFLTYHSDPKKRWVDWEKFPRLLFCAKTNSGKNVLLNELLYTNRMLLELFTIYVFTGTRFTNQFSYTDPEYIRDINHMDRELEEIFTYQESLIRQRVKRRVLIIVDDPLQGKNRDMRFMSNYLRLMTQGRQFFCSCICMQQDITFLLPAERKQVDFIVYFQVRDKRTLTIIKDEEMPFCDPRMVYHTVEHYTKDHGYLIYNHNDSTLVGEDVVRYGRAALEPSQDYTWVVGANFNRNRLPPPDYVDFDEARMRKVRERREAVEREAKKRQKIMHNSSK